MIPAIDDEARDEHPQIEQTAALLTSHFAQHLLPCALGIQAQVADGESLCEDDIRFFEDMLGDLESAALLLDKHPSIETLCRCASGLYDDILKAQHLNE